MFKHKGPNFKKKEPMEFDLNTFQRKSKNIDSNFNCVDLL